MSRDNRPTPLPLEQKRIEALEDKLVKSAFRSGTSAFRFGLIPEAPSDHLPISALATPLRAPSVNLMSWNLLADSHLYNNFMNISGSRFLAECLLECAEENLYCSPSQNRLYHFFSELAQYIYQHQTASQVIINESMLREFIPLESQRSLLARSRDPETATQKTAQAQRSREQIINLFLDRSHPKHGEFKLAIMHSLELIHHIKGANGALRWENRFQKIEENITLRLQMERMDFICLQECSSPENMQTLMNTHDERYACLQFRINESTDDHCAILFDQQKYELVQQIEFALQGKKPCLFGRFQPIGKPEQAFIVASIHHPGGRHQLLPALKAQIDLLKTHEEEAIEYFMLGDYNHTAEFFEADDEAVLFPETGSMAGSDYGNTNQAIDGVCSNLTKDRIQVQPMSLLPAARPSEEQLNVSFQLTPAPVILFKEDDQVTSLARANSSLFGYQVEYETDAEKALKASQQFKLSGAKRSDSPII